MRTTLTLDDDLASRLKQLAEARRQPFRRVVNEIVRRGLSTTMYGKRKPQPFRVVPFHSAFRTGVDPTKLNQLSDELDVRRFIERSGR